MSTAALAPARARSSRAMEGMSWVGLIAGLLLVASVSCLPTPRPLALTAAGPAAFTPEQLVAWAQAIAASVGLLISAANGAAIVWHRLGKAPRKHRSTPSPGRASLTEPRGGAWTPPRAGRAILPPVRPGTHPIRSGPIRGPRAHAGRPPPRVENRGRGAPEPA